MIYDVIEADSGNFTVDTSQKKVNLTALVSNEAFQNAGAFNAFVDGDNVFLDSMRIKPPYQFGHADGEVFCSFEWFQNSLDFEVPELGFFGNVYFPKPDIALCPGIQLAAPFPGAGNFRLELNQLEMAVSMMNVPSALNGEVLNFRVQCVVKHTLPMVVL